MVENWVKQAGSSAVLILMNIMFLITPLTGYSQRVPSDTFFSSVVFIWGSSCCLCGPLLLDSAGTEWPPQDANWTAVRSSQSSNGRSLSFVLQQNHNRPVHILKIWLKWIDSRWESVQLNNSLSLRKSISLIYIQVRFTPQSTSTSLIDFAEEAAVYCSHSESWTFWLISNIEN